MKNKLNFILIMTVGLVLVLACSTPKTQTTEPKSLYSTTVAAPSETPTARPTDVNSKYATVISENANLRKTPNSSGEVVQTVAQTEIVEVLKQKGAWFYVRANSQTGWMHGNTIRLNENNSTNSTNASTDTYVAPTIPRQTPEPVINNSGATAKCRDGSLSYSAHRRGTCSHHGGVAVWY